MANDLDKFRDKYALSEREILLFPYGSRVYGTASANSDYDYNCVVPDRKNVLTGEQFHHNKTNVQIYTRKDWQDQLNAHKIHCLEAYYLDDGVCRSEFSFSLNLQTLRSSLSEKSSHSFVKAKKKIEKEKDYYIGWKSLFHSLRILVYGIRIASSNRIDFAEANHYWKEIIENPQYDWDFYKDKYQPIYNNLATTFRKAAPK
jgi:predicted nucleotidyltransferase